MLAPILPAFVAGAILRDFRWFRVSIQLWPFNEKCFDWAKIEAYAAGTLTD
jgi:hypothetical protein